MGDIQTTKRRHGFTRLNQLIRGREALRDVVDSRGDADSAFLHSLEYVGAHALHLEVIWHLSAPAGGHGFDIGVG